MSKIVLDENSFKALSSDSRVSILKNLKSRRRTLSELSKKTGLGASTVKEHCDLLRKAELIEQVDEGRKWKYYELTDKGRSVIAPSLYEDLQVLITLCASVVIAAGILFFVMGSMGSVSMSAGVSSEASMSKDILMGENAYYETSGADSVSSAEVVQANVLRDEPDLVAPIEPQALFSGAYVIPILALALLIGIIVGWKFKK